MSRSFQKALLALVTVFSTFLPVSGWARENLDEAARASLLASGEARQFVKLPLGTMHVRIDGPPEGPVVLLVHGGVVGGFGFEKWRKPLADAGYRVIVPDLFGYGFSDRPNQDYTRDFYVAQIHQLLDALGIQKPVAIAGASLGGAIVTSFAASAHERVNSVVLMAPAGLGRNQLASGALLWPVVGDTVFHFFGPSRMRKMMDDAYVNSPDRESMAKWMAAQTRYAGFAEGVLNTLRHYDSGWQPEDFEALGRSGLPVLAVWGTADVVNPFEQSKLLVQKVPQASILALEGKGHAITFGESERVLQSVIPFLKAAAKSAGTEEKAR